jgi:tripartite-type tricarboxylate transporter receptor subunit TctC
MLFGAKIQTVARVARSCAAALGCVLFFLFGVVQSQDWPIKPVRLIYPYGSGGGGDIIARLVADRLSRKLGQQFVIENRPGAGGVIGSDIAAKSRPDGYTLVISGMGSHVVAPVLSVAPFDPLKDFTHIALLGGPPLVLAIHPEFPPKSLAQFLDLTRSRSEGVVFGSPGPGTHGHLVGEMLRASSGGRMLHAPYKGGGQAVGDLVAGHIPSAIVTLGPSAQFVRAGKLRLLAVTSAKRLADFPAVPTFIELGYKDLVATTWFGVSGPAGLPISIANKLNNEIRLVLSLAEIRERLLPDGIEPGDLDVETFNAFFRSEIDRWTPLARGIR